MNYNLEPPIKSNEINRDAWVAKLVDHPTLDLGSGHDLAVVRLSPASSSELGVELA